MHRFTPRTCLWPLSAALVCTFVLSIGLTFRSNHACYAGVCGEWLFPLQARLHVVVWYSWLSLSVTVLALRAFQPSIGKIMQKPILHRELPFLKKKLQVGGACIVLWILLLYGVVTAIWWRRLDSYFETRGRETGVGSGNRLLALIALTGHYGDITMGMALLPVSRHSALASFFKLSVSSTLSLHMLTAYTLFVITLAHGLLYVGWVSTRPTVDLKVIQPYPILEPTYLPDEVYPGNTSSLGIWRASLIFTGTASALIMIVIFFTTLPKIRLRHFNLFYFTHLSTILIVIIVCLHASTMFYCTAPGLAMIVLDWGMRLYDLRRELDAQIVHLGRGWYALTVELPRKRLKGCSCNSPLAHFYIQHGTSSIRELHPFTATTHLATKDKTLPSQAADVSVQFLFRKSRHAAGGGGGAATGSRSSSIDVTQLVGGHQHRFSWATILSKCGRRKTKQPSTKMQWTEKVASVADATPKCTSDLNLADGQKLVSFDTKIRLEGPYFTPATPQMYDTVLCIVAGTGVSGALAIAAGFAARWDASPAPRDDIDLNQDDGDSQTVVESTERPSRWNRLVICWSVREEDYLDLPFESLQSRPGLEFRPCLTGQGRPRMDVASTIQELKTDYSNKATKDEPVLQKPIWAYISGPPGFIGAAETVCKTEGIDYYGARWEI